MLRINAEPGYFTEIFTELKACGMNSYTTTPIDSSINVNDMLNNNFNNLSIRSPDDNRNIIQSPSSYTHYQHTQHRNVQYEPSVSIAG